MSLSELDLALRKGWAWNVSYKIEFILALNGHYLQFIIQFIEDKQQQTKKFDSFTFLALSEILSWEKMGMPPLDRLT